MTEQVELPAAAPTRPTSPLDTPVAAGMAAGVAAPGSGAVMAPRGGGAAGAMLPMAGAGIQPAGDCACGGSSEETCSCGGTGARGFVYAIGTVTARFPSLNIEKEFMQAWGKTPTQTLTISDADRFAVLSQGQNFYLTREMCWIFQSGDIDVFILQPRSYVELTDLVTCLSPTPGLVSYALVIGDLGPVAPPSVCNGAQLPVVTCDQVFSFTQQAFINSIAASVQADNQVMAAIIQHLTPAGGTPPAATDQTVTDYITNAANTAFSVVALLADNTGQTDEHRAINYLAFKSAALYKKEIEMELAGFQLNSVVAQPDPLSRARSIQDVILTYANTATTETRRFFTRVDVSGQFPFLLNELAAYYDHP